MSGPGSAVGVGARGGGGVIGSASTTTTSMDGAVGGMDAALVAAPFSAAVEEAMKEVLDVEEDELDDPDFDPVSYINAKFPNEDALQGIDAFLILSGKQAAALDEEILESVKEQALHGAQARRDIEHAKASITDLFGKIQDIKHKAKQSDVMVQDICADIKQLDTAKRHLTTTITALKRLQMLITAVERLQDFAARKQYQDAATLLLATTALFTQFEAYENVPKIAELHNIVNRVKRDLKRQIYQDFDVLTEASAVDISDPEFEPSESPLVELRHACAVVDALPIEARQQLLKSFSRKQFKRYDDMYGPGSEGYSLELVERRYAWFRNFLREYDMRFANVLPPHWDVARRVCIEFCEKTRNDIDGLLSQYDPPDSAPAEVLVRQLNKTLVFETEMVARFEKSPPAKGATRGGAAGGSSVMVNDDGEEIDPSSAEGVRRRYRERADTESARKAEEETSAGETARAKWLASLAKGGEGGVPTVPKDTTQLKSVARVISSCFDPYMGAYVKFERNTLNAYLVTDQVGDGDPDGIDRAGDVPLFSSSLQIFMQIKSCIKRCTRLNTGQPFFQLSREFKAALLEYAACLEGSLPGPSQSTMLGETYTLTPEELQAACVVVNTAEYCNTTVPQLADLIRQKIDAAFEEHVDMEEVQERFLDVIALALKVVAHGVACSLDSQLARMMKTKWDACAGVGDQSAYMVEISATFASLVPKLRKWLSDQYFRTMCEKFVRVFVPRYHDCIRKCRRVGEMGGHQLRVDANAMKIILGAIPMMGAEGGDDEDAGASIMYTNYLSRELPKIEILLTCVALHKDALAASIQALWPEATVDDVLDIIYMKSLKSREQADLLSTLRMSASAARRVHTAGSRAANIGALSSNMMSSVTKGLEALRK